MKVRSLDLLDLPFLPRYRQSILALDSARFVTRGNPLGANALVSYLNPRRNLHTALASEDGESLMGQVLLNEGDPSARLVFLAPADNLDGLTLPLLDALVHQAGEWGALHVLAEVDEDSPGFQALRTAGFAMYAWQRLWRLPAFSGEAGPSPWREVREVDWPAVQTLHAQIVPALLQPVENLPRQACGLVCLAAGGVQGYVLHSSGPEGLWLQPLIPPVSPCFPGQAAGLVKAAGGWNRRNVTVCVRSYQAWLETSLQELGAEPGPRQAVMVRRLAKTVREAQPIAAMEKALAKAKPAAPVSRTDAER